MLPFSCTQTFCVYFSQKGRGGCIWMYFLSPSLAAFLHYDAQNISGQQICTQKEVKHEDFLLFMVIEGNIDLFF